MRAKTLVILLALGRARASRIWPARQLGTEFMPNLNEGTLLYMPTTLPGISVTKAGELLQTQDRIIQVVSGSRIGLRQGRARRDRDRSGADRRCSRPSINLKPKEQWRPGVTLDSLIAEMDKALQFPGRLECLDHADQGPHRHAVDRHPHPGRRQGDRHRPGRDGHARPADRAGPQSRSRHLARPMRSASSAAITSTSRPIATRWRATASWSGRAGRRRDRAGRRDRHHHRRGTRSASASTCAIRATCAAIPQAIADDVLVPMPGGGAVPLGEVANISLSRGPTTIRTENGQLAVYIYVDIRDRDLGGYVADAQQAVAGQHPVSAGRLRDVERAVRISRARDRAAQDRRAGHAADHLPAALPEFPLADRNPDRDAVAAVRAGRRPLADVVARLQPVGRRGRRLHRACRRRGRNRRRDADLSRSGAGGSAGAV